ncbi:MAG: hypothetical protein QF473_07695, partial [Planctomycetota bacterium]|nr:hypothetical protein [Planctomycetota bacterium]
QRWVVNGPATFVTGPHHWVVFRQAITVGPARFITIKDVISGNVKNIEGPTLYFLGANEQMAGEHDAIPLKKNEYVRLVDRVTGKIRVVQGECSVCPEPTEKLLGAVQKAVNVDEDQAVIVRNIQTGQLRLVDEPQVFVPADEEEIVNVQERIRLEDHETVVIRDTSGGYAYRTGDGDDRSFFLQPHTELVKLVWSTGLHKDSRDLCVARIDSRPKFMWYEFEARTKDNVELVLGITFFWQITDVEMMLKTTDDTPGDICSHARSAIIQSVSQVTLEDFLQAFNTKVRSSVLKDEDDFYAERGVKLHAVEVRSIACKEPETQRILQEIIQETTNRLNQVQKQESENEVKLKEITGEIEAERMKSKLLEMQKKNRHAEASIEGEVEAMRVSKFFDEVTERIPREERVDVFNLLRKKDILAELSQGNAQLFYTPSDVDLTLETHSSGRRARPPSQ